MEIVGLIALDGSYEYGIEDPDSAWLLILYLLLGEDTGGTPVPPGLDA